MRFRNFMVQQGSHLEAVCGSIIVLGNFAAKDIVDEMTFEAFEHPIGDNIGCNGLLAANFWQSVLC